jgi:hypothetical protein
MISRWLLLVGVLQGWVLWALWKARELKIWPAIDPISERTLLYVGLALPLAFYLTHNIEAITRRRRARILILIGILFAFLGGYSGWSEFIQAGPLNNIWAVPPARPSDLFAAAVLGFIVIPLLAHFDRSIKGWSYHALFETAWRNVLMTASSGVLAGVFWIVLLAGAMLMKSIGLNFVLDLLQKPIFAIPATSVAFSAAFALGLARAQMIITLRRFWLTISAWLLPLLLAFSVMWAIALPFTGLELLFETHNAGFILLWFLALSINFANAAYQDGSGEQPYGRSLSKALEYAWLSLLVLAVVAWWAMGLRIEQYGWTEDRVWGIFVLLLATLYSAGYAYSVRARHGWLTNIGNTNIVTALVMSAGLVLLLSPLADARRIAVNSQMNRLMSGEAETDKIDYSYLRWEAGRYGHDALNELASGIDHKDKGIIATKARQTLAQKQRYATTTDTENLSLEQVRQRLRTLPQGEVLDDSLIKLIQTASNWREKRCMETDVQCLVWMVDLNNDGLKEAVVAVEKPEWSSRNAVFYHQVAKTRYKYGGTILLNWSSDKKVREALIADIESGNFKTLVPRFNDIEIGGQRVNVLAEQNGSGCSE